MKSRANKNAGKHPSYDKRGMSAEAKKKKLEYDKKFQKKKAQVKKRVEANRANRKAIKAGTAKKGDKLDASHQKDGSIRMEAQAKNRGRRGEGGRKRGVKKSTKK